MSGACLYSGSARASPARPGKPGTTAPGLAHCNVDYACACAGEATDSSHHDPGAPRVGQAAASQQPAGAREVRRSCMPELPALCGTRVTASVRRLHRCPLFQGAAQLLGREPPRSALACAPAAQPQCALVVVRKYGPSSSRRARAVQAGGGREHGSHPLDDGDGGQPHAARRVHGALH